MFEETIPKYKYDQLLAVLEQKDKTIDYLKHDIQVLQDYKEEDVWYWQTDGDNHLESLVCSVLIHPKDLIELLTPVSEFSHNEERLAFEEWFKEEYSSYPYLTENMQYEPAPAKAAGDFYVNGFIDMAYKGWQGRAEKQYSFPKGI